MWRRLHKLFIYLSKLRLSIIEKPVNFRLIFSLSLSFKVKIGNNILYCCFVQGLGGAVSSGSCQHSDRGDTVYEQRPTHGLHVNSCDSLTVSKSAANKKKLIRLTVFWFGLLAVSSSECSSIQLSSRWYLCTQESPYVLHPVSQKFLQHCLWNSFSVGLNNSGPWEWVKRKRMRDYCCDMKQLE